MTAAIHIAKEAVGRGEPGAVEVLAMLLEMDLERRAKKSTKQADYRERRAAREGLHDGLQPRATTRSTNGSSERATGLARLNSDPEADLQRDKPAASQGNLALTPSQPSEITKPVRSSKARAAPISAHAWEVYKRAFNARYGHDPIRSARVNKQLVLFCACVPFEEQAATIEHYLRSSNAYYGQMRHSVWLLARDAEKLCGEARVGHAMTAHEARDADRRQGRGNQYAGLLEELGAEDRAKGRAAAE